MALAWRNIMHLRLLWAVHPVICKATCHRCLSCSILCQTLVVLEAGVLWQCLREHYSWRPKHLQDAKCWGPTDLWCAGRGWSQPHGVTAEPQLEPLSRPAEQEPPALPAEHQPLSSSAEQQPVPCRCAASPSSPSSHTQATHLGSSFHCLFCLVLALLAPCCRATNAQSCNAVCQ